MDNKNIGIFDINGKYKNPLTNQDYSDTYKTLAKKWSVLKTYEKKMIF